MQLTLLGVGAMRSPRSRQPAFSSPTQASGWPSTAAREPSRPGLDAWLVCDDRSELQPALRRLAGARGLDPVVALIRPASDHHSARSEQIDAGTESECDAATAI